MLTVAQNQERRRRARSRSAAAARHGTWHDARGAARQLCQDMYAHKAGELAFLEAKLQLNASQQPLFARWKGVSLDIAKRHEGDCTGRVQTGARCRPDEPDHDAAARSRRRPCSRRAWPTSRPSARRWTRSIAPSAQRRSRNLRAPPGTGWVERMHMAMGMMRHAPQMGRRLGRGGPDGEPPMPPMPPRRRNSRHGTVIKGVPCAIIRRPGAPHRPERAPFLLARRFLLQRGRQSLTNPA